MSIFKSASSFYILCLAVFVVSSPVSIQSTDTAMLVDKSERASALIPPSIGQHNPGLTAAWLGYSKPDNLSVTYIVYPIPGSSLRLFISVWDQTLPQVHMGGVILKATNIIASRIQSHQDKRNSVLDRSDDPFLVESEPAGIIFGVRSTNQAKRLTYGELESTIIGVWKAMYQAEKYHAASIEVQDKAAGGRVIAEGFIKRGRLTPSRSKLNGLGELEFGNQ